MISKQSLFILATAIFAASVSVMFVNFSNFTNVSNTYVIIPVMPLFFSEKSCATLPQPWPDGCSCGHKWDCTSSYCGDTPPICRPDPATCIAGSDNSTKDSTKNSVNLLPPYCNCTSSSQCAIGSDCINLQCSEIAPQPNCTGIGHRADACPCWNDIQCESPYCVNGYCNALAPSCASDIRKPDNCTCTADSQCQSTYCVISNNTGTTGMCSSSPSGCSSPTEKPEGCLCFSASECGSSAPYCTDALCSTIPASCSSSYDRPNGCQCNDTLQCAGSLFCYNGVCGGIPPPPPVNCTSYNNRPDGCQCNDFSQCSSPYCTNGQCSRFGECTHPTSNPAGCPCGFGRECASHYCGPISRTCSGMPPHIVCHKSARFERYAYGILIDSKCASAASVCNSHDKTSCDCPIGAAKCIQMEYDVNVCVCDEGAGFSPLRSCLGTNGLQCIGDNTLCVQFSTGTPPSSEAGCWTEEQWNEL